MERSLAKQREETDAAVAEAAAEAEVVRQQVERLRAGSTVHLTDSASQLQALQVKMQSTCEVDLSHVFVCCNPLQVEPCGC